MNRKCLYMYKKKNLIIKMLNDGKKYFRNITKKL